MSGVPGCGALSGEDAALVADAAVMTVLASGDVTWSVSTDEGPPSGDMRAGVGATLSGLVSSGAGGKRFLRRTTMRTAWWDAKGPSTRTTPAGRRRPPDSRLPTARYAPSSMMTVPAQCKPCAIHHFRLLSVYEVDKCSLL